MTNLIQFLSSSPLLWPKNLSKYSRKASLMEGSDREIYQSVMDAIAAHENIKINGGDIIDDENDISHALPTQRDILKAVSTISKCTDNMNDPMHARWKPFWVLSCGNFVLMKPEP